MTAVSHHHLRLRPKLGDNPIVGGNVRLLAALQQYVPHPFDGWGSNFVPTTKDFAWYRISLTDQLHVVVGCTTIGNEGVQLLVLRTIFIPHLLQRYERASTALEPQGVSDRPAPVLVGRLHTFAPSRKSHNLHNGGCDAALIMPSSQQRR